LRKKPFNDGEVKIIRCPHCGFESRESLAWMRGGTKLQCAACGEELSFHQQKISRALNAVFKAFDDFRRRA
jgi:DNA-directed RNA polymerase subunit RPC12/RpoP